MPGDFDFVDEPAEPVRRPKVEPIDEDDDADERPRSRKTSRAELRAKPIRGAKKSMPPLVLGGLVLGALVVVGGGVALVFAFRTPEPNSSKSTPATASVPTVRQPVVAKPPVDPDNLSNEMQDRVRNATVLVRVLMNDGKGATGTGFIEKNTRLVITNAHVIGALDGEPGPDIINLIVHSGEGKEKEFPLGGEVLAVDKENDLALIAPKLIEIGERHLVPEGIVIPRSSNLRERQRLFIFGYPLGSELGKEITIGETAISSLRKPDGKLKLIQVQGGLNPGNSGGPLVDAKGNLVGVAVSIIKGTDLNFAIPADLVYEFLEKYRRK